jgi:hypothetical protein
MKFKSVIQIFFTMFFVLSLASAHGAYMENVCQVTPGTCDYYQCAEKIHRCDKEGYYNRFATPYCTKFLNQTMQKVSPQGKIWLQGVALCLQKKLAAYTKDSDPCWMVEEVAIRSHAECYVEAGGCELDVRDLMPVVNTFWKEFSNSRIVWQGIDYVIACAKRY